MKKLKFNYRDAVLLIIFLFFIFVGGCGKSEKVTNQQLASTVNINATNTTLAKGEQTQLTAILQQVSGNYTYEWSASAGDIQYVGTFGGNTIIWTAPSQAGDYTILLTVKNEAGNYSVSSINLAVVDDTQNNTTNGDNSVDLNVAPKTSVYTSTLSGEAPLAISFTGNAVDESNNLTYMWDFGDGTTAASKSTSHTFSAAGNYPISFTVTDEFNAATTTTLSVEVKEKNNLPQLNIISDKTSGNLPLNVNFTATCVDSDGSCSNIVWNTGDGKIYTGNTLNYSFTSPGNYKVFATATDNQGGKTTTYIEVVVSAVTTNTTNTSDGSTNTGTGSSDTTSTSVANQFPSVSLSADKFSGTLPLSVNFSAYAIDSDGTITEYRWDFDGDGNVDLTSANSQATYTYNTAGNFSVYVTVVDNNGAQSNTLAQIQVNAPQNYPPVLTASCLPLSGYEPLTVQFEASATDENPNTLTYLWDFGDGQTSALKSGTHTYASKGNYSVQIKITDEKGQTQSQKFSVSVEEVSVLNSIAITSSATNLKVGESAYLSATATYSNGTSKDITSLVQWNISPNLGSVSSAKFTATNEGTVTITATYQNISSNNFNINITNVVQQNSAPVVVITKYEENKWTPLIVDFYAVCTDSDGTCKSYNWNFGDGQTSTEQNPKHTFNNEGNYKVQLTATDDKGATATGTITVNAVKWNYKNKYPIILAHGFSGWDAIVGYEYFFAVKENLTAKGYLVYTTSVDAFNTIDIRGGQLANQIINILQQTGAAKVNIIGHSMGGLDARYAITTAGLGDKVASLTSISSPHYGITVADVGLGLIPGGPITDAINAIVSWAGCTLLTGNAYTNCKQNALKAAAQLTTTYVKNTFNPATPNDSRVKYYSYAGATGLLDGLDIPNPTLNTTYTLLYLYEGKNDGMCSVKSATWGEFKGQVGADHLDEIGQIAGITGLFDYLGFYENIASFLVGQGF